MSFPADLARAGIVPAQHHPNDGVWPDNSRLCVRKARVIGRDPVRGSYVWDKPTDGYDHGGMAWLADYGSKSSILGFNVFNAGRDVALWSQAFPARISNQSPVDLAKYKSNVRGQVAVPAIRQNKAQDGWDDDRGLIPQAVALPLGMQLPTNFPGVVLGLSATSEQQAAFAPSGNVLVAVHRGGDGRFGTWVYDTTRARELDILRRARLHRSMRVYLHPKKGEIKFGKTAGLAWQLGYDVDGEAGLGMVADSPYQSPPAKLPKNVGYPVPTGTGTQERPGTGSSPNPGTVSPATPGTVAGPGPIAGPPLQVLASTSARQGGPLEVGQKADPHHLGDTPDKEECNSAHLSTNALWKGPQGDASLKFDSRRWIKTAPDGPIWIEAYVRNDPDDFHDWRGQKKPTLFKIQTTSFGYVPPPSRRDPPPSGGPPGGPGLPPSSPGGGGLQSGPNPADGGGLSSGPNGGQDGSGFVGQDGFGSPAASGPNDFGPNATGLSLPGVGTNPPKPPDPVFPQEPYSPYVPIPGQDQIQPWNRPFSPGGAVVTSGIDTDDGVVSQAPFDKPFVAYPTEIGTTGLLARAGAFNTWADDLRNQVKTLTPKQRAQLDRTPISGQIVAFTDQRGRGFNYVTPPGRSRHRGGTSNGGFAFLPPNVDVQDVQLGRTLPPAATIPISSFVFAHENTILAFADLTLDGSPASGYTQQRTGGLMTFNSTDASGNPTTLMVQNPTATVFSSTMAVHSGLAASRPEIMLNGELYLCTDTCEFIVGC